MAFSAEDKIEIRYMIAREIKKVVKAATNAARNPTIDVTEARRVMTHDGKQEFEAQKKAMQRVVKILQDAADANERDADAARFDKTDPARAERIRKLVPSF